jgi:hypothetical protein
MTHLHTHTNVLEHLIDNGDVERGVVATKIIEQHGEEVDVAVLDLPDLGERAVKLAHNLFNTQRSAPILEDGNRRRRDARQDPPNAACGRV